MQLPNTIARPSRLLFAAACLALFLLRPAPAAAHPLGNFSINLYSHIAVGTERVAVRYVVDMAEIPTFQEWGGTAPQQQQQTAYLDRLAPVLLHGLQLDLDGKPAVLELQRSSIAFPAGQGGLLTTRIELELAAVVPDSAAGGQHHIVYQDNNYADRQGWHEIVVDAGPGMLLRDSAVASSSISDELRAYPADLLSSPLDVRSATATLAPGAGGTQQPTSVAGKAADDTLAALIAVDLDQPAALAGALLAALALGAAHALSPGHGKTIVAAYLVGSRGTPRHALFLGLVTTATHTIGVFMLGVLTLYASRWFLPERVYPWLGVISGVLVVLVGASLLRSRLRSARAGAQPHGHDHSHDGLYQDGQLHEHAGAHGHHGHSHLPPAGAGTRVAWRSLAWLAISGGLAPCPTALVLMLGAIAVGRAGLGLLLVTVFSAGLALVLTGIGLLFLYGGRRLSTLSAARLPGVGVALRLLPVAGALTVTLAGLLITLRAAIELV